MKKVIKASQSDDKLTAAIAKLREVQSLCGDLEDYYFNDNDLQDAVVQITRCYKHCENALSCLNRAYEILV